MLTFSRSFADKMAQLAADIIRTTMAASYFGGFQFFQTHNDNKFFATFPAEVLISRHGFLLKLSGLMEFPPAPILR
jgi:hypothetical protein